MVEREQLLLLNMTTGLCITQYMFDFRQCYAFGRVIIGYHKSRLSLKFTDSDADKISLV